MPALSSDDKKLIALAHQFCDLLEKRYPEAQCSLESEGEGWKLMIMGILSAQCTDARVNIVCRDLFKIYPTPEAVAESDPIAFEEMVRPCGFFRMKAKNIRASCAKLVNEYHGKLPETIEELVLFPGVGRKIANLLIGDVYHKPAIVTDTHCIRICGRIGLYPESLKEPQKIEKILIPLIQPEKSADFCHRLVEFGRDICDARAPKCDICPAKDLCLHNK